MIFGGKTAVITGGSRGIGFAIAESFARAGANLLLVSRSQGELEKAKSKLAPFSIKVEICSADISDPKSAGNALDILREKFDGRIDILVNAAGIYGPIGPAIENDLNEWRKVIDINLIGTFLMIKTFASLMKNQGGGKIINFVGGGEGAFPNFSGYAASKGAIARLNETVAEELRSFNISVNAIAPGAVNTKLLDDLLAAGPEKVGRETYERFLKQKQEGGIPPEKAADLCLFLASDAADGITGKILSAVWDNYSKFPMFKEEIINSNLYNLRRTTLGNPLLRKNLNSKSCSYKIAVVGLWHLGEIYSAGLAELGHYVIGIDEKKFISPPVVEPKLESLISQNQSSGRLSYEDDFGKIAGQDILWITLDTPINDEDKPDTKIIFETLGKSIKFLKQNVLIIVSSQLPVGTSKKIIEFVKEKRSDLKFNYVYSPENLRLGNAVNCFFNPERIIVGTDSPEALVKMEEIFADLNCPVLKMSMESAEVAKHALNAFLATSLSFTYDIADVCEKMGADIIDVKKALVSDSRIGVKAYLDPSLGFSGGTLGRDLNAMLDIMKESDVTLPVIESVLRKNRNRKELVVNILKRELGILRDKSVTILGATYKAGTPTLRRSLPLEMKKLLEDNGVSVRIFDVGGEGDFFKDPYKAAEGADAIAVVTPGPELGGIDFAKLKGIMKPSAVFFDTRNFFADRESEIRSMGFKYIGIGR